MKTKEFSLRKANDRKFTCPKCLKVPFRRFSVWSMMLLLVHSLTGSLHAQVVIGGLVEPKTGSLLDLNATKKGGLVLSNVDLQNFYSIPGDFGGTSVNKTEFTGAIIYNTGVTSSPAGVYVWNGTNWTQATENCTPLVQGQVSLTPPVVLATKGDAVTFSVATGASDRCAEGETYDWYMNNAHLATTAYPVSTRSIPFASTGTYRVKVAAKNRYGDYTSSRIESKEVLVSVTDNGSVHPNLADGNYTIRGSICYNTDSLAKGLTKIYHFSHSSAYSELEILNPGGIVERVALLGNASGTGKASVPFTLTFKQDAKNWVTAAGSSHKVTLLVRYKNNKGELKFASLDIKVRNSACCTGVIIPGGVHTGPDLEKIPYRTTYVTLINTHGFVRDEAKDLCIYYRNASKSDIKWHDAVSYCSNGAGIDKADYLSGTNTWRLPNIAELGQMANYDNDGRDDSPKHDALYLTVGADPRTENMNLYVYWSSTKYEANTVLLWQYNFKGAFTYTVATSSPARCVRTMD